MCCSWDEIMLWEHFFGYFHVGKTAGKIWLTLDAGFLDWYLNRDRERGDENTAVILSYVEHEKYPLK